MSKLYVIGNIYSDNTDNANELFTAITDAGYTLGYNTMSKNSAVIMKEVSEEENTEE